MLMLYGPVQTAKVILKFWAGSYIVSFKETCEEIMMSISELLGLGLTALLLFYVNN